MACTIQVRVDDELKVTPCQALTEHELLEKLEKSREHAGRGMFRDADEVSHDMRAKYGL